MRHIQNSDRATVSNDRKLGRDVFSTGQVASMFGVAPRTVSKWFDLGYLSGGYRIPGSNDRRVPASVIRRFAQERGLPVPSCLNTQVLLCGFDSTLFEAVRSLLADLGAVRLKSLCELGVTLDRLAGQHLIALSATLGKADVLECGQLLRRTLPECHLIRLAAEDEAIPAIGGDFDAVLTSPTPPVWLAQTIRECLSATGRKLRR